MRSLALFAALALAAPSTACVIEDGDDDATLTIFNESSYTLTEVRLAEVGDRVWGPNLLPDVLFPGEQLLVTEIDCARYDVLVVDETNVECVLANVDMCFSDESWVIDDFTLDVCAFSPAR
jgi:hypothetical protein